MPQDIVEFKFNKIKARCLQNRSPKEDLAPGFYFAGTPQGLGFAGGRVFDFSVAKAQ
jgi:hypothetical protein